MKRGGRRIDGEVGEGEKKWEVGMGRSGEERGKGGIGRRERKVGTGMALGEWTNK